MPRLIDGEASTMGKVLGLESKIRRTADFFLMPTQDDPLLHRANVKYSHGLVPRCARKQVTVWSPCERLYGILVLMTMWGQPCIKRKIYEIRTAS